MYSWSDVIPLKAWFYSKKHRYWIFGHVFLKWRHSSPIFHYVVNFIGRGQSGKFKAWFYSKKHRNWIFGFENIFRCYRDTKTLKKKPFWPYGHLKARSVMINMYDLFNTEAQMSPLAVMMEKIFLLIFHQRQSEFVMLWYWVFYIK